jgi:hypothetical protein
LQFGGFTVKHNYIDKPEADFPHTVSTKTFVKIAVYWFFILTFDVLYKKAAFLGEGQKLAEVK